MTYAIEGETGRWETVIGLEVHAQIISKTKLFSGAATEFGAAPNSQVSLVDAAMPGMLPVINGFCVEQAVKTGLGLKAQINRRSVFDRKNYFYADLPQGYQISQYQQPIVGRGEIVLDLPDGATRTVGITRLHLEQDAGKSLHDQSPKETYVDLNRSGVALMEIVSEPDLRGPEDANAYLRKLRAILRYLGTCDGNMEEGSMRCDVNVSVRREGDTALGTRCEIKNVSSIRFVMAAIEYEARRQVEIREAGGSIVQETRLWDTGRGETRSLRNKEEAHDYRYFPDPDLLPLEFDEAFVEAIRATLPELPDEKKARFMERYQITPYQAAILVADKDIADAFEREVEKYLSGSKTILQIADSLGLGSGDVYKIVRDPDKVIPEQLVVPVSASVSTIANWITGSVFGIANSNNLSVKQVLDRVNLPNLLFLEREEKTISGRIAKDVFLEMFETGHSAADIVAAKGWQQESDSGVIDTAIDRVLAEQADKVAEFRAGKDKLFGFFVGQVMKATAGKANPAMLNDLLRKKLAG